MEQRDAVDKNTDSGGFVGIDAPHFCPLPTLHLFRKSKNPPLWTVWECPSCGKRYRYGYSYVHDDSPGWCEYGPMDEKNLVYTDEEAT